MHRYDQIMADIDAGASDEILTWKYGNTVAMRDNPSEYRSTMRTMHVYRLVHDGKLPPSSGKPTGLPILALLKIIRGEDE